MLNEPPAPTPSTAHHLAQPTVAISRDDACAGIATRLSALPRNDGILAAYVRRTDVDPVASAFARRTGLDESKWLKLCEETYNLAVAALPMAGGKPLTIQVGKYILSRAGSSDGCWTLVLVYVKGHPIVKSIRRMLRRTLVAMEKQTGR